MTKENQINSYSIISLIIGILSIVTPVFGIILGIIGIVFSRLAKKEINNVSEQGRGLAVAGLVCSIVGIIIHIFIVLGIVAFFYLTS